MKLISQAAPGSVGRCINIYSGLAGELLSWQHNAWIASYYEQCNSGLHIFNRVCFSRRQNLNGNSYDSTSRQWKWLFKLGPVCLIAFIWPWQLHNYHWHWLLSHSRTRLLTWVPCLEQKTIWMKKVVNLKTCDHSDSLKNTQSMI